MPVYMRIFCIVPPILTVTKKIIARDKFFFRENARRAQPRKNGRRVKHNKTNMGQMIIFYTKTTPCFLAESNDGRNASHLIAISML